MTTDVKANRAKLVEALRSGEFTQHTRALRNYEGTEHCCLGVACEIYRRETGNGRWDGIVFWDEKERDGTGVLAPSVQEWYGFDDPNPAPYNEPLDENVRGLAYYNDNGMEFSTIASVIEDNFD